MMQTIESGPPKRNLNVPYRLEIHQRRSRSFQVDYLIGVITDQRAKISKCQNYQQQAFKLRNKIKKDGFVRSVKSKPSRIGKKRTSTRTRTFLVKRQMSQNSCTIFDPIESAQGVCLCLNKRRPGLVGAQAHDGKLCPHPVHRSRKLRFRVRCTR
jgi:hypothetical protein